MAPMAEALESGWLKGEWYGSCSQVERLKSDKSWAGVRFRDLGIPKMECAALPQGVGCAPTKHLAHRRHSPLGA